MSDSKAHFGGGIGLGGAVFIVFLVLKLCGVIDWSWWWVTSPLWIPLVIIVVVGIAAVLVVWFLRSTGVMKP